MIEGKRSLSIVSILCKQCLADSVNSPIVRACRRRFCGAQAPTPAQETVGQLIDTAWWLAFAAGLAMEGKKVYGAYSLERID